MVRSPCCEEFSSLKKGPWTSEEDQKLVDYINRHGHGSWKSLPKLAGLNRCGKSCRLRWINYLRPDIKRGKFSEEEERIIINLHSILGNKWSKIASHIPGRTDNEIKNFWNTHIRKKFRQVGIDPITHQPRTDLSHLLNISQILFPSPCGNLMSPIWDNNALKLQTDATQLVKNQLLQNLLQLMKTSTIIPNTDQNNHYGVLGFDPNLDPFTNVMTQATMNLPGSSHQASTGELEVQTNSCTWFEAGLECLDGNIQQESKLPPLIHASSDEISPIENKSSGAHDHLATFEAWEKFMDDETSDSYWKNIQELTPSSSSPISW